MGNSFSGGESLEMGMRIEMNEIAFYEALTAKVKNEETKHIYEYLAGEEKKHLVILQEMQKSVGQCWLVEGDAEEHMLYLNALVDSNVFLDDRSAKEMANNASSEVEALQIGIIAERDSILFYSGLRSLIPESVRHVIDAIIAEEEAHLKQLSRCKAEVQRA